MDATAHLANPAERRKQVRLRVRPDLQITEQKYEGKTCHVVKDPVCLRYYRFNKQEYYVFQLFDGQHTMEEVRLQFEDEFKPHRLEYNDLESFARQLVTAGLVQQEAAGTGKHLFARRAKQRRMKRIAAITNILYWKIPVFDPDRLLTWMYGWLWWIFTWPFFVASVGLMLAAAGHVLLHFQTFYDKLPAYHEFFAFNTVLYLWLSLCIVKIIHEFGHGLSCKAFGGECHEMGILLMCLSPALYANVTDAWTIADKWKRIIISFAGIYVELIIAAIATFVWWYTPEYPITNNIALCLMTLCSVSTFVFNANPLMRFDGYYMMADWLEIPNLRDRANKYLTGNFLEIGLGIEQPPEPYMETSRKILFVTYAIISYVYRWVVTFSIIWFLSDFLGPQLKIISQMIAVASLASMIIWPIYNIIKNINNRGRLPDMKPKRVAVTLTLFTLLAVAFFMVPLPISRVRQHSIVAVHPDATVPVGLEVPGQLSELHIKDGQSVVAGQVIATFVSVELQDQYVKAQAEVMTNRAAADDLNKNLSTQNNLSLEVQAQYRSRIDQYREKAKAAEKNVKFFRQQLENVETVRAPRDGVVSGVPRSYDVGKLFDRTGSDAKPFCNVGDPTKLVVRMPVTPNDYRLLKENMKNGQALNVSIYVNGRTDHLFHGKLSKLPDSDAKQVPPGLTQRAGGPLAVKQAGENGQEVTPVAQTYIVEIDLENPDSTIRPGTLVNATVHCRWRSCAWWVGRALATAMDIGLYGS
ncbi:MAG: biotin/lipoyl-binding protein [Gemmataceae bacterium]